MRNMAIVCCIVDPCNAKDSKFRINLSNTILETCKMFQRFHLTVFMESLTICSSRHPVP